MLNEAQKELVEKNHNLIYWYIRKCSLDIEEWYDILAIELCNSAIMYDCARGSFSNYFKMRCDNVVMKEHSKKKAQKRAHEGLISLDDMHDCLETSFEDGDDHVLDELLKYDKMDIMKMKLEGYTQFEIAKELGVHQSYISRILTNIKEEYMRGKLHDR